MAIIDTILIVLKMKSATATSDKSVPFSRFDDSIVTIKMIKR